MGRGAAPYNGRFGLVARCARSDVRGMSAKARTLAPLLAAAIACGTSAGPTSPDAGDPDAGADGGPGDAGPGGDGGPGDGGLVWPNAQSAANSSPWIAEHHAAITEMRPRFLVVSFANGIGLSGGDNTSGGPVTTQQIRAKAESFLHALATGSTHQPGRRPSARPFLAPEIAKVIDLQDRNGHANSDLFPRGPAAPGTPGYPTVGYWKLFTDQYAPHWQYWNGARYLNLAELVAQGLVNEVIMVANQVDGNGSNPAGQVTAHILEVAFVAQAYDADFRPRAGEFVRNGCAFDRQKTDVTGATYVCDNTIPWTGRSLRIYFLNVSRGAGCLLHSLGHEFEFRYNESRIHSPGASYHGATPNPWMQPLFRKFADFDMRTRYGAAVDSLYAGSNCYTYADCAGGICSRLDEWDDCSKPMSSRVLRASFSPYRPTCGNVHYPPGAAQGYDYHPASGVLSDCETFMKDGSKPAGVRASSWGAITADPRIDQDCGGDFLVYWFQNMPGPGNEARDLSGSPMKNWWPFLYY